MSVSIRPLLFPAVAVAAAGTVALSPVLVVAPDHSALAAASIVDVRTADVALAGFGQDIYYAITPTVQYAVGGVSYIINIVPIIGGVIAAQININYFQGIQPVVEATVNYLAGVVQDPLNFFPTTSIYASTLYDIGYNWVSAELRWAGLAPLPPLPPSPTASVSESAPRPTGARATAAATAAEQIPARADLRRTARSAAAARATTAVATTADTGAQESADAPDAAVADTPSAAADTAVEVRTPARATRGQAARAGQGTASEVRGTAGPTGGSAT